MHISTSSAMLLVLMASSLPATLVSGSACPPPLSERSVRLPPFINPGLNASNTSSPSSNPSSNFLAPPPNFFAGTWYVRNVSNPQYGSFGNLQWDLRPVLPSCEHNTTAACPPGTVAGVINEISTWVPNDNTTARSGALGGGYRSVASIFAYNTPRRLNFPDLNSDWDAVFDNTVVDGVPTGWTVSWSVIAWKSDTDGLPFMITYEAVSTYGTGEQGEPVVSVISMNPNGPDDDSVTNVLKALMDLGNADLTAVIEQIAPTKWNSDLEGGPAICGTHCRRNEVI